MIFVDESMSPLKIKVDVTAEGNIKQSGDTTAGTKYLSINGITSEIDFNAASDVAVSIVGGVFGATFSSDFKQTVDREVAEGTTPDTIFYPPTEITLPTETRQYYIKGTDALMLIYKIKTKKYTLGLTADFAFSSKQTLNGRAYAVTDNNSFVDSSNKYIEITSKNAPEIPESWRNTKFNLVVIFNGSDE